MADRPRKYNNHDHVTKAKQYARDVARGKIAACRQTQLACQRFLDDLKRKAKDFEWTFNKDRAERACRFVELLPHVKGKWSGGNLVLEPWQCFIYCNLFGWEHRKTKLRRFRRAFVFVPRKNGKTTMAAPIGLLMLTVESEPGAEIYCLDPNTPVLKGDFTWEPINNIEVGDKLIGFEKNSPNSRKYRKYRPSWVESKNYFVRPSYKITFEDGGTVISSAEHQWLTPHTGGGNPTGWKETQNLKPGNSIRYFGQPWENPIKSYESGYVSGFFDGEGCVGNGWNKERAGFRLTCSQKPGAVLDYVENALHDFNVKISRRRSHASGVESIDINSAYQCFRFLGIFQPKRLIEKSEQLYNGRSFNKDQKWRKIISIDFIGDHNVVGLKTTTGTFIADGLCSHNCGATSEDQANEVFRPAHAMAEKAEGFKETFSVDTMKSSIFREDGLSFFKKLIGKPGEGQSPYCAIHDEFHEHATSEQIDSMDTGMGARQEPLQLIITTAGTDISSPCKEFDDFSRKVLEGTLEDERLFALHYAVDEGDDWEDFETWKKANPNLDVSVSEDYLRGKLNEAKQRVSQQNTVRTKHLNQWMAAGSAWMNMSIYQQCEDPGLKLDDFKGEPCWVGIDLASKIDITARMMLFRRDETWYVFGRYYLPEDTVQLPENDHYRRWVNEGWITETDGARTDFQRVEEDLREDCEAYPVKELAFDPKEASYLVQNIQEWASFECVEIPQGPAHMSEPMKELEAIIYDGKLRTNGDPVLAWMMSNVVKKQSKNSGAVKYYYPSKERDPQKIDGVVALIMALGRAVTYEEDAGSYTAQHGVMVL